MLLILCSVGSKPTWRRTSFWFGGLTLTDYSRKFLGTGEVKREYKHASGCVARWRRARAASECDLLAGRKCLLPVYLPDVGPDTVYLLRCSIVSGGLKRANGGWAAFPTLLQLLPCLLLPWILIPYIFCDLSIGCGSRQTVRASPSLIEGWRLLPEVVWEIPHKGKA